MIEFVLYDEVFLELSKGWLNDTEMKRLTNTPDFTEEEQKKWFLTLNDRKDYYIRGILCEGKRIGALGLKGINSTEAEYWAYIGEKDQIGKGIGWEMFNHIVQASKNLKLEKISGRILKTNERSIGAHTKMGFKIIKNKSLLNEYYIEYDLPY